MSGLELPPHGHPPPSTDMQSRVRNPKRREKEGERERETQPPGAVAEADVTANYLSLL